MRAKCPNCKSLEIIGTPICANCHAKLTWDGNEAGFEGKYEPPKKPTPVTWKLFGAFLLAVLSFILIWPFAIAGFAWECITYAFEFGRGAAIRTALWVKNQ